MSSTLGKDDGLMVMKCCVCNHEMSQGELAFCLFSDRFQAGGVQDIPMSEVLSSILSFQLLEETLHSKVICEECNTRLYKYMELEQQMLDLKYKIIQDFNITSRINDGEIQFEIEEDFDAAIEDALEDNVQADEDDNSSQSQTGIEDAPVIENDIGEPSNTDLPLLSPQTDIAASLKIDSDSMKAAIKQESTDTEIQAEEYFDQNTANMVEIIAENDEYSQLIEEATSVHDDSTCGSPIPKSDSAAFETVVDTVKVENQSSGDGHSARVSEKRKRQTKTESVEDRKPCFTFNGDRFTCIMCPGSCPEFEDVRTIFTHLKTIHNLRVYICDICGENFRKRTELTEHMDDEHGGTQDGEFQCETCNRIFTNLRQFRIHKRLHLTASKSFQCGQCDKKYSSKNLLDEHMNMHTGMRPYKCQHCTKDFASKYTLTAHMKIHSNRPRPYSCSQCSKAFFSAQNLLQHEKIHSGVKEYLCEVCDKAFGTQHNLEVHKVVHTGYKPFICRTCGKAFARRAEIKDHERTHTGERPYSCDICEMSFAQRSNLTTHKRATHFNDKRYKCEECSRSFKRRRLLDYHMRASHTGERPYVCNLCNATFVYPEHYKKHLRIHSGVKPYACEVCGKTFNSRDNRNAHRFIHSDKKPYECLVCGQGFMRKPLLYTHMQQSGHINDTIIINQPRILAEGDDKVVDDDNLIEMVADDEMIEEHLIIDGPVQFGTGVDSPITAGESIAEENSISNEMLEDDLSEVINSEQFVVADCGDNATMQLVQIRTKDEDGKDAFTWVNFVAEKES